MDDDPLGSGDDEPNSEDEEKDFDTEDTIACQWEKVRERDRKFQQLCPTNFSFEAEKFDTHHQESHCSILYNLFGYVNLCALKQLVHVLYCTQIFRTCNIKHTNIVFIFPLIVSISVSGVSCEGQVEVPAEGRHHENGRV